MTNKPVMEEQELMLRAVLEYLMQQPTWSKKDRTANVFEMKDKASGTRVTVSAFGGSVHSPESVELTMQRGGMLTLKQYRRQRYFGDFTKLFEQAEKCHEAVEMAHLKGMVKFLGLELPITGESEGIDEQ